MSAVPATVCLDADATTRLRDSLARMGLLAPGEPCTLTALTGGVSSLIVRVDREAGALCIKQALAQLKVAAQWLAPVERNSAEVAWLRFAAGVRPDAVPAILGVDPLAQTFAMSWLPPQRYPVWKQQLRDGQVDPAFAAAVAQVLAAIHRASAGRAELAAGFANDDNFRALRLDPYFAAAAQRHPDRAERLHALIDRTAGARIALMHGDVSPKNLLAGPDGPVLLDAECACYGDPAFDLAFCLTHLLLKCLWRPAHAARYGASFDALVTTYLRQVDWEPAETLEARTVDLLAAMLLARVDGKSPVEYLADDAPRDTVRQFARAALLAPPRSLAALRTAWAGTIAARYDGGP